jgi:hypothetical protein
VSDSGSAPPLKDAEDAPEYSYWRVWVVDDSVRVARDWLNAPPPGPRLQPQHLSESGDLRWDKQRVVWEPHMEGAEIPSVSLYAFVAWLDQGGGR